MYPSRRTLRQFSFLAILMLAFSISGPSFAEESGSPFKPHRLTAADGQPAKPSLNAITGGLGIDRDPIGNAKDFVATLTIYTEDSVSKCTGVVLTSEFVLTAGHCLSDEGVTRIEVGIIRDARPLKFEYTDADDFRVHPSASMFSPAALGSLKPDERDVAGLGDLALVHLKKRSSYAIPAVIVPGDFRPEEIKDPAIFSFGYGRDPKRQYEMNGSIEFIELQSPDLLWGRRDMYVSLSRNDTTVCKGDSGGPVTISGEDDKVPGRQIHYLLGIHSVVSVDIDRREYDGVSNPTSRRKFLPCGREVYYVNVVGFLDWIMAAATHMSPKSAREIQIYGR